MQWEVFTALLCQLSHQVGSAEGECQFARTLHSYTRHTSLQAHVTDAPSHSRWFKVATKQSCICQSLPVSLLSFSFGLCLSFQFFNHFPHFLVIFHSFLSHSFFSLSLFPFPLVFFVLSLSFPSFLYTGEGQTGHWRLWIQNTVAHSTHLSSLAWKTQLAYRQLLSWCVPAAVELMQVQPSIALSRSRLSRVSSSSLTTRLGQ